MLFMKHFVEYTVMRPPDNETTITEAPMRQGFLMGASGTLFQSCSLIVFRFNIILLVPCLPLGVFLGMLLRRSSASKQAFPSLVLLLILL